VRRLLAAVCPLLLVCAACGGDDGTADGGDTEATSTSILGDDDATTVPTTVPTTGAPSTTEPTDESCLVGTWVLRSQDFFDQITSLVEEGVFTHVGGEFRQVIREDGTSVSERLAWAFQVDVGTDSVVVTVDARNEANLVIDGDRLDYDETSSTRDVRLEAVVDGERVPVPVPDYDTSAADLAAAGGTFECEGDVLSVTVTDSLGTVTSRFDRA
jgi:hypothetical protein